jgi:hypothetical protein
MWECGHTPVCASGMTATESTDQRRLIAGHEAGHAIVAHHFGSYVSEIKIGGLDDCQGVTWCPAGHRSRRAMITVALAGLAADLELLGLDPAESCAGEDYSLAQSLVSSEDMIGRRLEDACKILWKHRAQWQRLTERLMTVDELTATEIWAVIS